MNSLPGAQTLADTLIATFTDGSNKGPSAYVFLVDWGDGTVNNPDTNTSSDGTGNVTIVQTGVGTYEIHGSHNYAEAGSYTINFAGDEVGAGSATRFTSSLNISDPPLTNGTAVNLTGTEGQQFSSTTIANFSDAAQEPYTAFSATIFWGDGTNSPGTVISAGTAGNYSVIGGHTYAEENSNYTITTAVTLANESDNITITSHANIADAAITGSAAILQPVWSGIPISFSTAGSLTIGTFTDNNPGGTLSDYTASIAWGDGSTTPSATITQGTSGTWDVNANHTYATAGSFTATVTVNDVGGATPSIFTVPFTVNAPINETENTNNSMLLGTFNTLDPNPTTGVNVTINWGDGTPNYIRNNQSSLTIRL